MFYKTIKVPIESEIVEKKSRFICILSPITAHSEVEGILTEVRKKYPGANHYCYAYRVRSEGNILEKYNDDGEPGGTAGVPLLNVLQRQEVVNLLALVVRYFGGTLLGRGGLVRAYSGALSQGLDRAETITMEASRRLRITLDHSHYGNFQNKCLPHLKRVNDTVFAGQVIVDAWVAEDNLSRLIQLLDDLTTRTATVEYLEQGFIN